MKEALYKYCEKYKVEGDLTMSFQEMIDDLVCTRDELISALYQLQEEEYLSFCIYKLPGGIPYEEEISMTIWRDNIYK